MTNVLAAIWLISVLVVFTVTLSRPQDLRVCTFANIVAFFAGLILTTVVVI